MYVATDAEATADRGFPRVGQPPLLPFVVASSTNDSHSSMETLSDFHLRPQKYASAAALHLQLQNQIPVNYTHSDEIQNSIINITRLIHQMVLDPPSSNHILPPCAQSHWESSNSQGFVNMDPNQTTPDLLSLLDLPRCLVPDSMLLNSSILCLPDDIRASSVTYDPLFHLNVPQQPSLAQEQSQSLPNGYSSPLGSRTGCLLGDDDRIEANGGVIYAEGNSHGQFDNGIPEFKIGKNDKGRGSRKINTFKSEYERRIAMNNRFDDLQKLIPSPSKGDRASIVGVAIEYIKELVRTINELKLLVEKKRCEKDRSKRASNYCLRSSWLQRKSKVTEVDVCIIDDEVNIKIVQKKKINCLLFVSKVLDQLQLDLQHVAGGQIGEHYSFLFNTKTFEGSRVCASAIADTLMEIAKKQDIAALPPNGY